MTTYPNPTEQTGAVTMTTHTYSLNNPQRSAPGFVAAAQSMLAVSAFNNDGVSVWDAEQSEPVVTYTQANHDADVSSYASFTFADDEAA